MHSESDPRDVFTGGGEMGALMRSTDWSKTKLGPTEAWPTSLKTVLGVLLRNRFPMFVWWGPDLLQLYNDEYRAILKDKHPASLGAPGAEVWSEIWDVVGPMARGIQEGGPATWTEDLLLFITNGDMAEERYFTFSFSAVPDDAGNMGGVLATVQETTLKVQAERQIRMLHDLSEKAGKAQSEDEIYPMAVDVFSTNGSDLPFVILYVLDDKNDTVRRVAVSGWDAYPSQDDANASFWPFDQAMQTGHEVIVDNLSVRFDRLPVDRENACPERAIVFPLFLAGRSKPYAFMVAGISLHRPLDDRYQRFFRSTAEQLVSTIANTRAYEVEKKRAEALAEIDREKTTFFSNVSHEFRTPLTLILGPVEDALGQPEKSLQGENLATVHRNAIRLLRLVNSLLDFSRIEAGRLHMAFALTDISAVTIDLASSFRSLIEHAGLRFVIDCPSIEPVWLDSSKWEKIVLNLISNAFKFTFKGEISVVLRAHDGHVELTVRDSGIGIPSHELPHIFERFHRVENATGRSFEGTGIGLSLVYEFVKHHEGEIRVSSIEGEGSTFTVSIPRMNSYIEEHSQPDRAVTANVTNTAASYVLEASQWGDGTQSDMTLPPEKNQHVLFDEKTEVRSDEKRGRVLVVDDNADMRNYLCRLLSTRWHVDVAEDGEAALISIFNNPPDLVLSDVMMPKLDGFGLLRSLREDPRTSQLPIILLSARAGEETVLEGLETSADDYIIKPFSSRELFARVQSHLELARQRRQWAEDLKRAYHELEAFSYSVSHDLRAPLRTISGFSNILRNEYASQIDEQGCGYLQRIESGTQRMGLLIDDLLRFSQCVRVSLSRERINMTVLARKILREFEEREPKRKVEVKIAEDLFVDADPNLFSIMLDNLLSNAWKFTSQKSNAMIEVGMDHREGETIFFVRDNGAGLDMAYANRIFEPFQRLHSEKQFSGTGIGLAMVSRIIARHGGRIWVDAQIDRGATFFFTMK